MNLEDIVTLLVDLQYRLTRLENLLTSRPKIYVHQPNRSYLQDEGWLKLQLDHPGHVQVAPKASLGPFCAIA